MNSVELMPRASVMIEAMRDIGYSFEAAVADIVDNSIAAQGNSIELRYGWTDEVPWIAILDNGRGMSREEMLEAMRPGSKDPRLNRDQHDLGRFGLGLKTASFSQCRQLNVGSRNEGKVAAMAWDLDHVAATDRWEIIELEEGQFDQLPCAEELGAHGTLVLWQKIDRLALAGLGELGHEAFNDLMSGVREHLSRIFHRFLSSASFSISMNGSAIEPFDPFNEYNIATQKLPVEHVQMADGVVTIQPFILPHHSKVSPRDYERLAGAEGYLRNQGFYIYRNKRLILWGSWFRLARQEELTKLARVRIDIPNNLDYQWGIDVRKSRAHPPLIVRNRLKQVIEQIRASAKRPYTTRGRVVLEGELTPVWVRKVFNDRIAYAINTEHPIIADVLGDLDQASRGKALKVLDMIGQTFPASAFFSDYAAKPQQMERTSADAAALEELARLVAQSNQDLDGPSLMKVLSTVEPFARHQDLLASMVQRIIG